MWQRRWGPRTHRQEEHIIDNMKARIALVDSIVCTAFNATVPFSDVRHLHVTALDLLMDIFTMDQYSMGIPERIVTTLLLRGVDEQSEGFYHIILDEEHCLKVDFNGTQSRCEI